MFPKTQYFQNCLGVFQGGGCRGAAFVGAYREATKRGVSFSEIVGTSAGSITAVLIAAGATPNQLEEIVSRLDFASLLLAPVKIIDFKAHWTSKLIYPFRKDIYDILTKLGRYDSKGIERWIETELKNLLKVTDPVKFKDLIIPTTIVVSDLKTKKVKLFGNDYDENEEVAIAVRKSCNIPFYFQPIEKRYVDGGLLSNLPSFVFREKQSSIYERILAFTLSSSVDANSNGINTIEDYLQQLATTTIDGSIDLQMTLQKNVHAINIPTGSINATDFDKLTKEDVDFLIKQGEGYTKIFFDNEVANIKTQYLRQDILKDYFRAYNEITHSIASNVEEIIVCDINTSWVYDLFPSLIGWVMRNARITVISKHNNDDPKHGPYRKRLLGELGCNLAEINELPMRGVLINSNNSLNQPVAIVFNETIAQDLPYHSKMYHGEEDYKVISLLREACIQEITCSFRSVNILARPIAENTLFISLKRVPQYSASSIHFELVEIEIEKLTFLTRFVRGFKFRQISTLYNIFQEYGIPTFKPAEILYPSGKSSLITPPIIEKIGDKYYVIEGNTRLTYAYKNGLQKLWCTVIYGVTTPLPSTGRYMINEILITDKEKLG